MSVNHYSFDADFAGKYGIEVAIFISLLERDSRSNDPDSSILESIEYYAFVLPFWTKYTIEKIIKKCIRLNLILKDDLGVLHLIQGGK